MLSLRRAGLERKWRAMQEQLDAGVIIEAPVIDHNKGGLIVDCGIRGFVPISQIVDFPRRPQNEQPRDAAQEIAEKLQPYVGRKLRLKILEVNRKANRLILSEKVALYEERREKRDELFSSLQVGQQVKGTVRSIAPFGVFIDLGGIDGLVHKSELSWNKVNNPEAGYQVGEEVEAEVIDINHERGRISLSIRRLQPDPWHSTVADLKVGDIIDGTVTKIVNFGAFVRVRDGLEGLIHISELSHQRVAHPGDVVHEGQRSSSRSSRSTPSAIASASASSRPRSRRPGRPRARQPAGARRGRARAPAAPGARLPMSEAVQEPEGGIDNTLAAAFAQVRQQIAAAEGARRHGRRAADEAAEAAASRRSPSVETVASRAAEAEAAEEAAADAEVIDGRVVETVAADEAAEEAPRPRPIEAIVETSRRRGGVEAAAAEADRDAAAATEATRSRPPSRRGVAEAEAADEARGGRSRAAIDEIADGRCRRGRRAEAAAEAIAESSRPRRRRGRRGGRRRRGDRGDRRGATPTRPRSRPPREESPRSTTSRGGRRRPTADAPGITTTRRIPAGRCDSLP